MNAIGRLVVACAISGVGASWAPAQDYVWYPLGAGVNDYVQALTVYNGDLIAGGAFTAAGDANCNHIARWDGSTWHPLGSGMDGVVYSFAEYNGELIAAGDFTTAGGLTCNRIARWDGSTWRPLGSGIDGPVWALTVYNGELIAGGYFTTAGGVICRYIARWNGSTWQPLGSETNGPIWALSVYNGVLIAGGSFTTAGGATCSYIARWDGTQWQPLGAGMNGAVYALTVYNGELIAGGYFFIADGVPCNNIARWNGSEWQQLGSGTDGDVFALTVYNGELIAGGAFTTAGGITCNHIARWNGTGWQTLGTGVSGNYPGVNALTTRGHELVVGGDLTGPGALRHIGACSLTPPPPAICRTPATLSTHCHMPEAPAPQSFTIWNCGTGTLDYSISVDVDWLWCEPAQGQSAGEPDTVTVHYDTSSLPAGHHQATIRITAPLASNSPQHVIVNLEISPYWWGPLGGGTNGTVRTLTVYNGELIGAGYFTTAGGVTCNRIARWDGTQWQPLGSGITGDTYPYVVALTVYSGELIAGGPFTSAGGVTCNRIARWDGTQWQPLGSGMTNDPNILPPPPYPFPPSVNALTVYNGELIAGGRFDYAGVVECNNIARWDGTQWRPLGSGIGGTVYALAVYNGELIAGGDFGYADGVTCRFIARWNGTQWQPLGSGMDATVGALTVYNGELIAGGSFTRAGGVPCSFIARWDGTQWQPLGSGMVSAADWPAPVLALTVYDGELIAGGDFDYAGGVPCSFIARWNGTQWQPLGSGMSGGQEPYYPLVRALTVYNGDLIAGGYFTTAGGVTCNHIAAWGTLGACCYPDGLCQLVVQSTCTGNFVGPGTRCIPNPCHSPGACCFADGTCQVMQASACMDAGGTWNGAPTCDPNPCGVVLCPGDTNCDGQVTADDIDYFVEALSGEENWTHWPCPWLNADCNGDNDVTLADIDAFVALIGTQCP